jgi:DNA adenine methylase
MKPFIKWVGGKTQIIDEVLQRFPREINNYYEPFLGGGSVLIGVLSDKSITIKGKVVASDVNPHLIALYKKVQENPKELLKNFNQIVEEYSKCPQEKGDKKPKTIEEAMTSKESYYYWIRDKFNIEHKPEQFVFLNKTCFRGLHREGPNGFNVPFGHYKTLPTLYQDNILKVSKLFENVKFVCQSFEKSFETVNDDDFIYMDPPYVPVNTTSFTSYTKGEFNHGELFTGINALKCRWLLSNADVPILEESVDYGTIDYIECRRAINSKDPASKINEVLISSP